MTFVNPERVLEQVVTVRLVVGKGRWLCWTERVLVECVVDAVDLLECIGLGSGTV